MTIEVPTIALLASLVALFVAVRNYSRKAGVLVRGSFSVASSRSCNDRYVAQVTLENQKDRAVTVFGIYLRVDHGYYVEVENFENTPLILKAYEVYHKEFGPIEFYAVSSKRIDLNKLLEDDRVKKRLVLSTGDGKYVVRSFIPRWHPVGEFFRNYMAGVVRPIPSKYKDTYLGGNMKFVVEFVADGGKAEIVALHPRDYELQTFKAFRLTPEALANKDALTEYLNQQCTAGVLKCSSFEVHDIDEWRKKAHEFYKGPVIQATSHGMLQFHLIGRGVAAYEGWRMRRLNARTRKAEATND